MKLRKLEKEDIPFVIALEDKILNTNLGTDFFLDSLVNKNLYFYVIEEGNIIGYISSSIVGGQTEIYNFLVDTSYQRKGYGQKLFDEIIKISKENNSDSIVLEVRADNLKGQSFYFKNGFKKVSIRKNYYSDGTDACLLIKEL